MKVIFLCILCMGPLAVCVGDVILTVSGEETSRNLLTDQIEYFHYKEGETIEVRCSTFPNVYETGRVTLEKTFNNHTVYNELILNKYQEADYLWDVNKYTPTQTPIKIRCNYTNYVIVESTTCILLYKLDTIPVLTYEGDKVPYNDGKYNLRTSVRNPSINCTTSEKTGTLHWEYCDNPTDITCTKFKLNPQKHYYVLKLHSQNVHNKTYRCVYTNVFNTTRIAYLNIQLLALPKLSCNGKSIPYNDSDDSYSLQISTGDSYIINCSIPEDGGTLHWENCIYTSHPTCTKVSQKSYGNYNNITLSYTQSIMAKYMCVFTDQFESRRTATLYIDVRDLPKPQPQRAEGPNTVYNVTPVRFRYGEEVLFECKTSNPNMYKIVVALTLPTGITTVPGKVTSLQFTGKYKMNVTSDVNSRCIIYVSAVDRFSSLAKEMVYIKPIEDTEPVSIVGNVTDAPRTAKQEESSADTDKSFIIWGLVAAGICLIAVLILTILKVLKNNKKTSKVKTNDVDYTNLTNETNSPTPPFPRGAKLEETYLAPADCQATIRTTDTDTYAQPYKPATIEELYAKPMTKKNRQKINEIDTQVLPKAVRKPDIPDTYAEVSKNESIIDEDNYAIIAPNVKCKYANVKDTLNKVHTANNMKEDKYVNVKDENYTNVFANESYVNTRNNTSDYAEPSYCELSRKN